MESKLSKWVRAAFVPAVGLCLTTPIWAASAAQSSSPSASTQNAQTQTYRALRASQLIGKQVKSPEGKTLGKIEDMIVDMNTGQVRYSILAFDPGVLSAERLFAVPTTELRITGDRDDLIYNMTRERLDKAGVGIERKSWPGALRDRKYLTGLDTAYGVVQPAGERRAYSAKELIGKDVNNRQGNDIGDIKDLVINMGRQTVHYAVLAFDPSWTTPEKLYAFPLRAFNFTDGKDELVLDVDKAKLTAMRSFDTKLWSGLNDPVVVADIDRYLVTVTPVVNVAQTPASLFQRLDSNNDGFLNEAEAKANSGVHATWAKLDQDKDGRISRAEFTANYRMEAGAVGATR